MLHTSQVLTPPTDHLRAGQRFASPPMCSIHLPHLRQAVVPAGKPALTVSDHFTLHYFLSGSVLLSLQMPATKQPLWGSTVESTMSLDCKASFSIPNSVPHKLRPQKSLSLCTACSAAGRTLSCTAPTRSKGGRGPFLPSLPHYGCLPCPAL